MFYIYQLCTPSFLLSWLKLNLTILLDQSRWLTFLLGSQTIILTALLFWIYFILLMLVFVLQWLSLHWEILIRLLSQFPLIFHHIHNGMLHFIALLLTILVLTERFFVIIWKMFRGRMSLNSVLLLLLVNFVGGFRFEFTNISLIERIRSSLTQLSAACAAAIVHSNLFFFVCPKRINLLNLR